MRRRADGLSPRDMEMMGIKPEELEVKQKAASGGSSSNTEAVPDREKGDRFRLRIEDLETFPDEIPEDPDKRQEWLDALQDVRVKTLQWGKHPINVRKEYRHALLGDNQDILEQTSLLGSRTYKYGSTYFPSRLRPQEAFKKNRTSS